MKKSQKGFIIPAMIAIVLILTISGGIYVYLESKKFSKIEIENIDIVASSTDTINNIQTTSQKSPVVATSSENKNENNSASNSKTTTEIKNGTKTVTKSATSTKTLFTGNDGSK